MAAAQGEYKVTNLGAHEPTVAPGYKKDVFIEFKVYAPSEKAVIEFDIPGVAAWQPKAGQDNEAEYKAELAKVQSILKDDRYEELFRGGNSTDGRIVVKYIGTDTTIDELILFGSANNKGFAIVRVLGDNMEPAKIMKLGNVIKDATSQEGGVAEFMNFFK